MEHLVGLARMAYFDATARGERTAIVAVSLKDGAVYTASADIHSGKDGRLHSTLLHDAWGKIFRRAAEDYGENNVPDVAYVAEATKFRSHPDKVLVRTDDKVTNAHSSQMYERPKPTKP